MAQTNVSIRMDEDLKRESEASILATERRIKGIQELMDENKIPAAEEE